MRASFERDPDSEEGWTGYNPSLGRPLLNSTRFLETKPAAREAAAGSPDTSGETPPASPEPAQSSLAIEAAAPDKH